MNQTVTEQGQVPGKQTSAGFQSRSGGRAIVGVVIIILGLLFLLEGIIPGFSFHDFWPFLLIALGIGLIWRARK